MEFNCVLTDTLENSGIDPDPSYIFPDVPTLVDTIYNDIGETWYRGRDVQVNNVYVSLQRARESHLCRHAPRCKVGFIVQRIYVLPHQRRQKLASTFLQQLATFGCVCLQSLINSISEQLAVSVGWENCGGSAFSSSLSVNQCVTCKHPNDRHVALLHCQKTKELSSIWYYEFHNDEGENKSCDEYNEHITFVALLDEYGKAWKNNAKCKIAYCGYGDEASNLKEERDRISLSLVRLHDALSGQAFSHVSLLNPKDFCITDCVRMSPDGRMRDYHNAVYKFSM